MAYVASVPASRPIASLVLVSVCMYAVIVEVPHCVVVQVI